MNKIAIVGAGQLGTAISNNLSTNSNNQVTLFSTSAKKVEDININNRNSIVYPNVLLNKALSAASDYSELAAYRIIFLALPASAISDFTEKNKDFIANNTMIVNLAKGLITSDTSIVTYLNEVFPTCDVVSLKGPTFAAELLNGANSLFTFAYKNNRSYTIMRNITDDTTIYLDFSTDVIGVEILSILKNVYAILLGYIDAKYNASNTRYLVLTKAFNEIKIILRELGGREETVNLACGYGDLGLTSLNDLSVNRTLGLLMGKGFNSDTSNNNVLELMKALEMISSHISPTIQESLPLFSRIHASFSNNTGEIAIDFREFIMQKEKRVITYGTFDLLHYGHLEILSRASNLGTDLTVGLSTDNFNKVKGKTCVHNYEKRKEFLESLSYVNKVIPEDSWDQKVKDIEDHNIDIFIMGDDWKGKFDELKAYCEVAYLPRTRGVSTTQLKKILE